MITMRMNMMMERSRSIGAHATARRVSARPATARPAIARRTAAGMCGAAALLAAMTLIACGGEPRNSTERASAPKRERIVVLGGSIAEIVHALGAGEEIVGADISCTYPAALAGVSKVGYQRTIAAEQVLSLNPTLVIASDEAGPPTALAQLRDAGVRVAVIPGGHTAAAAEGKIEAVARLLGLGRRGDALRDTLRRDLNAWRAPAAPGPRVIYLHARGNTGLYVAGEGTAADAIIRLAGAVNAASGFSGYRPLTPESGVEAAPEYVLISEAALHGGGGAEAVAAMPGLAGTPAALHHRVIAIDDLYTLGFGPRLGRARAELAARLAVGEEGGGR